MSRRRSPTNTMPLFAAVACAYGANCALGTAVAAKVVDTSGFRWVHHALYVATCAAFAVATSTAWWGPPRARDRRAVWTLMPAAVPLVAISVAGARGLRHPLIALAAAPFIASALVLSRRPADRK